MNTAIPYGIVLILGLALGALLMKQCSTPEVVQGPITVDTLRVTEWAVKTEWKTRLVKLTDSIPVPYLVTDSSHCCDMVEECADQLWALLNFEAEAEQTLPGGGLARVGFSMPIYREKPEHAFSMYIEQPDTNKTEYVDRYPVKKWYHRIGISAGAGYGAGPLGLGPSVNLQVGYELFNLSDIWR